ncbi:MAG: hypothetical protein L0K86_21885 [Actinomycetia bacterium]|nr:hypothetical protein [Actinomycetes bacterium]
MSDTPAAPNEQPATVYRLDPRPGLRLFGMRFILAAALVIVAWLCAGLFGDGAGTIIAWLLGVAAVLLIIVSVLLLVRPPAVVRLDDTGYRLGRVPEGGVRQARWTDVTQVTTSDSNHGRALVFGLEGAESRIPLLLVAARSAELQREVHDRLNRAHGYRRLE